MTNTRPIFETEVTEPETQSIVSRHSFTMVLATCGMEASFGEYPGYEQYFALQPRECLGVNRSFCSPRRTVREGTVENYGYEFPLEGVAGM